MVISLVSRLKVTLSVALSVWAIFLSDKLRLKEIRKYFLAFDLIFYLICQMHAVTVTLCLIELSLSIVSWTFFGRDRFSAVKILNGESEREKGNWAFARSEIDLHVGVLILPFQARCEYRSNRSICRGLSDGSVCEKRCIEH